MARIPDSVRREVALRHGCEPGQQIPARCAYCSADGKIHWHRLRSGRPSGWVSFVGLELDHVHPSSRGGASTARNLKLACRRCNRSKRDRRLGDWRGGRG
jgi:5-methylcytosine-specific restriction endonuclease McrA